MESSQTRLHKAMPDSMKNIKHGHISKTKLKSKHQLIRTCWLPFIYAWWRFMAMGFFFGLHDWLIAYSFVGITKYHFATTILVINTIIKNLHWFITCMVNFVETFAEYWKLIILIARVFEFLKSYPASVYKEEDEKKINSFKAHLNQFWVWVCRKKTFRGATTNCYQIFKNDFIHIL